MVNNITVLGMYNAGDSLVTSHTKTYNTGESTHICIAAISAVGQCWEYADGHELGNRLFEYPKLSIKVNGVEKVNADAEGLLQGTLCNLYYEVPKNSNIEFIVTTKHGDSLSLGRKQGVKLINFIIF